MSSGYLSQNKIRLNQQSLKYMYMCMYICVCAGTYKYVYKWACVVYVRVYKYVCICIKTYKTTMYFWKPSLVIHEVSHSPLQMIIHPPYYTRREKYSSQLVQEYSLGAKFYGLLSLYLMCILNIIPKIILCLYYMIVQLFPCLMSVAGWVEI